MNRLCWLSVVGAALLGAGCASTPPGPALTGDPLVDAPRMIQQGPLKDRVLWEYRLAAAAMHRGQYAEARQALDSALARIDGIFSADKDSQKAKGYFTAEAKKTFLGEPYERVMAYYYRGILYWMDGEPDNARACFRSGQFHDGDAENKAYAGDYVLLDYLDGWVTAKLGGDGTDAFQRARANCKLAIPPEARPKDNTLFFVEHGHGPQKVAAGQYGEQLKFREGTSPVREAMIKIGAKSAHIGPYDDLNFQATTRGGRVMDHILGNKAVFKSATSAVGDVGIMSGAIMASQGNSDVQAAGWGLLAAGLLSKIVSASTRPDADTRTWDNLPLYLSFASFDLAPGQYTATVEFLDGNRRVVANLTKTISFTIAAGTGDKVIFVSDNSTTPQNL